jgi:hypothetical protein
MARKRIISRRSTLVILTNETGEPRTVPFCDSACIFSPEIQTITAVGISLVANDCSTVSRTAKYSIRSKTIRSSNRPRSSALSDRSCLRLSAVSPSCLRVEWVSSKRSRRTEEKSRIRRNSLLGYRDTTFVSWEVAPDAVVCEHFVVFDDEFATLNRVRRCAGEVAAEG